MVKKIATSSIKNDSFLNNEKLKLYEKSIPIKQKPCGTDEDMGDIF